MGGGEIRGRCGHLNPAGARFCGECGQPLPAEVACPSCGEPNASAHRFCTACGAALRGNGATGGRAPPAEAKPIGTTIGPAASAETGAERPVQVPERVARKIRAGRATLEGERKHVTVLFADVVGSMDLAESTDPETWQRVMDGLFAVLCDGVHRFEGTVDKFTGDGLMAIFGAPIAHEDHAQRACYAALHLQQELAALAAELRRAEGLNISVRIGINSGEVVVGAIGDDLGMDYTAVGHTVGLAQRMESLAEPGKTYLTAATAALVEGYLALADLGEFNVKGSSRPLRVYELTGTGKARGRLDVARARGLSRFIGRGDEIATLERALEQAVAGEASVIGIVGDAGVGKSRLCSEFAERCRRRGMPVYHVSGQAHAKSVPLVPVLELMRAYFDIGEDDSDQTARERIAGKLLLLDPAFADDLPVLFDFLGVRDQERPPPRMDPEARQRQLLDLSRRLIRAQSAREPGVNLFEDLHWLDPASEAFLANHIEAVRGTHSLTVVNFRPEYHADWMAKSYYRQIALLPLGIPESEELLTTLLGSHPSLAGLPDLIRERTGGNPFFIEELVRTLDEAGNLAGEPGAYELVREVDTAVVPPSVQSVLAARIDRLSEEQKAVLQAAAVLGKEFSQPVLEGVLDMEPDRLEAVLDELMAAEFVFQQELYPETRYAFKHPLTQEVAYGSQLGERRAAIHAAAARAIAERYPERLDERAALLAEHWEAAGESLEAARWHARAGAWAGTHDPRQAIAHWRRVAELAEVAEDSDEAAALGLSARIFILTFGWRLGIDAEQARALFDEAEAIAVRTGDIRSRALLLGTYSTFRGIGGGDLREMAALAERAIALAEETGDPALIVITSFGSYAQFLVGRHRRAIAIVERAMALLEADPTLGAGVAVGSPRAYCLAFKGGFLIELGRLAEARELIERGARVARDEGDIEMVGWAHMWATLLDYYWGDPEGMLTHAQRSLELAERIGDSFSRAFSRQWLGFALLHTGDPAGAVDALERAHALATERRTASEAEPLRLTVLGQAKAELGDVEEGLSLLERGAARAAASGYKAAEIVALLGYARVAIAKRGAAAAADAEAKLARAKRVLDEGEVVVSRGFLHEVRAELAAVRDDEEVRQRELLGAHRLWSEMGAEGRAREVEQLRSAPAG